MVDIGLRFGQGLDWMSLGLQPDAQFNFIVPRHCTVEDFKQCLSDLCSGALGAEHMRLRFSGKAEELTDYAGADQPNTSKYQPQPCTLAYHGVKAGSILEVDVLLSEEDAAMYSAVLEPEPEVRQHPASAPVDGGAQDVREAPAPANVDVPAKAHIDVIELLSSDESDGDEIDDDDDDDTVLGLRRRQLPPVLIPAVARPAVGARIEEGDAMDWTAGDKEGAARPVSPPAPLPRRLPSALAAPFGGNIPGARIGVPGAPMVWPDSPQVLRPQQQPQGQQPLPRQQQQQPPPPAQQPPPQAQRPQPREEPRPPPEQQQQPPRPQQPPAGPQQRPRQRPQRPLVQRPRPRSAANVRARPRPVPKGGSGHWTALEVERLADAVAKYGKTWSVIERETGLRDQCALRYKWRNLAYSIRNGWSGFRGDPISDSLRAKIEALQHAHGI